VYNYLMWIYLEDDEFSIITEALEHLNLHGLNFIINSKLLKYSPYNLNHTRENAVKSAQTYFSADDLEINDDYVRWDKSGDALVMAWQRVPKEFIPEDEFDCGCSEKNK
jgi:hypothetical protein